MLKDRFGRLHDYLRISLTDKCNLRCLYCMPDEHYNWMDNAALMQPEEIETMARLFIDAGVKKIRLTGGEPLARKAFPEILARLDALPVTLALTTNAILADRYMDVLLKSRLRSINVSLDTLQKERFFKLAQRDRYDQVMHNLWAMVEAGFRIKINVVAMKGINHDEVLDFIRMTVEHPVHVRFIEFMPFDGNRWQLDKVLTSEEILETIRRYAAIEKLRDAKHATAKSYRIKGAQGTFAIISTVTEPFCSSCNRLRITAEGKLRNCLFSREESDLLTALRTGKDLTLVIRKAVMGKHWKLGGLPEFQEKHNLQDQLSKRSMIRIGG